MSSRETTLPPPPDQEKAKKRLEQLFDEMDFMFTETSAVVVQANGTQLPFCEDHHTLKNRIQTIHWLHCSNYRDRWYALVTFTDGKCGYIRCRYETFWSIDNEIRFYVGESHTELIQYAMRKSAYKSFRRRVTDEHV